MSTNMKFAVTPLVLTPCVPLRAADILVHADEARVVLRRAALDLGPGCRCASRARGGVAIRRRS